nr:DUF927 domain-containing protein [Pseudomonas toyotomiensis]
MTDRPNQPEPSEAFGAAGQGEATPSGKRQSKPSSKPALKKRKAKIKQPTVTPARPSWATYASWVQTRQGHVLAPGLYFHGIRDDAETDTLVCSPLEVLAITCDERGENFGRLLHLLPKGASVWKQWAAPMEMLAGDGAELRAVLLNMGATIPHKQRQALMDYLMSSSPERQAMAATRTGWYGPTLFVMPRRVIGGGDVVFQSTEAGGHEYDTAGDLAGWQTEVAARCLGNPVLILAVCAALAGPLLTLLDADGGGFHLLGDSSSGKSIALAVAASRATSCAHGTPPARDWRAWPRCAMTPCWCSTKSAKPSPRTWAASSTPWAMAPAVNAARCRGYRARCRNGGSWCCPAAS